MVEFRKKLEPHLSAIALYVARYTLCRVHESLRSTLAMAVGVSDRVWPIGAGEGVPQRCRREVRARNREFIAPASGRLHRYLPKSLADFLEAMRSLRQSVSNNSDFHSRNKRTRPQGPGSFLGHS
jgi:hypothetical protein